MEYFTNAKEILLLDGRQYVTEIRSKPDAQRKWYEKIYLWFHDNFEMIMIVGGSILLALLIFTYLDEQSTCTDQSKNKPTITKPKTQNGGGGAVDDTNKSPGASSNSSDSTKDKTAAKPSKQFVLKPDSILDIEAKAAASERKRLDILSGKAVPEKTTNQKMRDKFLSSRAEQNIANAKAAVKNMPGKAIGAVVGKSAAAWKSVKSGEALEKGKEKFTNALGNAGDFAQQHAKAGYALAFTTFMVIGFGLFFVPTIIMFVIGAVTLVIFNKQKMQFFESI